MVAAQFTFRRRSTALALATMSALVACDKDPSAVSAPELTAQMVSDSVISRQGAIRILFSAPINEASALDQSNFVVTNACTGLPVAGSLRLAGNTVIFTPSQQLPFLTALVVRVQGILDESQRSLPQPLLFRLRTETPPVSDISWQQLPSPTNDNINGVSFLNPTIGWVASITGGVYKTDNGGQTFGALFKQADITATRDIRVVSADTLYMVGFPNFSGTTFSTTALFRSVDGGKSFQIVFQENPGNMFSLSLRRRTGAAPEMVIGGSLNGSLAAWRFDQQKDSIARFGPVGGSVFGNMADLSPDGANAVEVGQQQLSQTQSIGVAYRSVDGGRHYTSVPLRANTPTLRGLGFINNTTALLLGDTSTVIKLNATTGDTTYLGLANGIPQTEINTAQGSVVAYTFQRAAFAPDDRNVGWIIGVSVRRVTGQPDVRRGIILTTRDGGNTFTRQAVSGASENGLGFPGLRDIFVQSKNFSVIGGESGFLAARKSDTQNFATVCSFPTGQ